MRKIEELGEKLVEAYSVIDDVETYICQLFQKHEPDIYNDSFDFDLSADWYDNSIEIFFNMSLPYPYEPSKVIRDAIYAMGFSIIYWNFREDKITNSDGETHYDEIRGWEPRRNRGLKHILVENVGYVDYRYHEISNN